MWESGRITPVLKAGNSRLVTNYRPVTNISFVGKLSEQLVLKIIKKLLTPTLFID